MRIAIRSRTGSVADAGAAKLVQDSRAGIIPVERVHRAVGESKRRSQKFELASLTVMPAADVLGQARLGPAQTVLTSTGRGRCRFRPEVTVIVATPFESRWSSVEKSRPVHSARCRVRSLERRASAPANNTLMVTEGGAMSDIARRSPRTATGGKAMARAITMRDRPVDEEISAHCLGLRPEPQPPRPVSRARRGEPSGGRRR